MIRVTSEAICETAGSVMNQHCGKNRFLQPENFNIDMYLKFNLGPLHLLDNFVKEILASDSTKSYFRKEQAKISRIATNDLNKSAAMETIEKRILQDTSTLLGDMPIRFIGKNFALFYPGIKH